MNIVIDIGNTRTKAFLLNELEVVRETVFTADPVENIRRFILREQVDCVMVSASGTFAGDFRNYLMDNFKTVFFDHHTKLPIRNRYRTPETLGKDRLAAVVGAFELYPSEASLVVDLGTCVTYDAIDAEGNYYGGSISPGLKMRCKAMHHYTARLPEIEPADIEVTVGFDTASSLLTGVVLGLSYEVDGFIQQYQLKYKELNVILTGGDAELVSKYVKSAFLINKRIALMGLNKILRYNV